MSRRKVATLAAAPVTGLVVLVLLVGVGASSRGTSASDRSAPAQASSLRPHPRVVVALAPGEVPPASPTPDPTTGSYGNGPAPSPETLVPTTGSYADHSNPQDFRPPSDAEVKRELAQLHVLGLGGSGYVNPFAHVSALTPERIDMGVDYSGTGPVVSLGSGTVFNTNGGGWPGGVFIGITLDRGPYARRPYFIAEDVIPTVRVGQHVEAGQVIGTMYNGGSGIEIGWAAGHGDVPLAAALSQQAPGDPGGWSSAAGISFDRLLVSAGAPSGIPQGTGGHGTMPAGYP